MSPNTHPVGALVANYSRKLYTSVDMPNCTREMQYIPKGSEWLHMTSMSFKYHIYVLKVICT